MQARGPGHQGVGPRKPWPARPSSPRPQCAHPGQEVQQGGVSSGPFRPPFLAAGASGGTLRLSGASEETGKARLLVQPQDLGRPLSGRRSGLPPCPALPPAMGSQPDPGDQRLQGRAQRRLLWILAQPGPSAGDSLRVILLCAPASPPSKRAPGPSSSRWGGRAKTEGRAGSPADRMLRAASAWPD